jgi:hypothetical protein
MLKNSNRMVVEGEDDKFAIIELMGHHTDWPDDKKRAPVLLEAVGDPDSMLKEAYIPTKLNESGTKTLGLVFDADENFQGRWSRVRQICDGLFQSVPAEMPKTGLILQDGPQGQRLGIWIMPDNSSPGMLETFLSKLIRAHQAAVVEYAESVVIEARRMGAGCKEVHVPKANIHTWLAWQDPPGLAFGRAITARMLDPHAELATPFVDWFRTLYDLKPKST